ncbi:hypothetical protein ACLBNB_20110 [Pseudomonas chlororaphis subsp. aurantiaca]|uniref:hypothetical protein n=1 Tax=Pseudomonas chlororaphis TaxID=587753 RepID=UPI00398A6270
MNDKMREEFENFVISRDGSIWVSVLGESREYKEPIERDFAVWQASRETLVVELTEKYELPPTMDMQMLVDAIRKQDIATIEAQGLKVKP